MEYDLELSWAAKEIKRAKAKNVLIQLPDGLKPRAKEIHDYLEKNTKAKVFIWLHSCYGACDIPLGAENAGIDLLIQWGHSEWK